MHLLKKQEKEKKKMFETEAAFIEKSLFSLISFFNRESFDVDHFTVL